MSDTPNEKKFYEGKGRKTSDRISAGPRAGSCAMFFLRPFSVELLR